MALCVLSFFTLFPTLIQSQACESHDNCPSSLPFCYDMNCASCDECHYCSDGIDGTCGPCGDGYPLYELPCNNSDHNAIINITNNTTIKAGESMTGFNVSDDTDTLSDTTITCPLVNDCHIMCHNEWGCASLVINASLASNLYVECAVSTACDGIHITEGPTNYLNLHCGASEYNQSSCSAAYIDVSSTQSVELECGVFGCWYMTMTAQNIMNLSVQSDYGGAVWSTFNISNTDHAAFGCFDGGSYGYYATSFYFDDVDNIEMNAPMEYALLYSAIEVTSNEPHSKRFILDCAGTHSCSELEVYATDYLSRYCSSYFYLWPVWSVCDMYTS